MSLIDAFALVQRKGVHSSILPIGTHKGLPDCFLSLRKNKHAREVLCNIEEHSGHDDLRESQDRVNS